MKWWYAKLYAMFEQKRNISAYFSQISLFFSFDLQVNSSKKNAPENSEFQISCWMANFKIGSDFKVGNKSADRFFLWLFVFDHFFFCICFLRTEGRWRFVVVFFSSNFSLPAPRPLEGALSPNRVLSSGERLLQNLVYGPESFAMHSFSNAIYSGLKTGHIIEMQTDQNSGVTRCLC